MADDVERNKLAGPPEPSMLEHAQHFARNWWNRLGQDMHNQQMDPRMADLMRKLNANPPLPGGR